MRYKRAFFSFLRERWETLFEARFDILLYDLTSTYFERDPPFSDKRRFGYSRDKRSDCVKVVIALVVNPQGFPPAYEVMPGNTSDKTTLAAMRDGEAPMHYLVGTPKGRLTRLEQPLPRISA